MISARDAAVWSRVARLELMSSSEAAFYLRVSVRAFNVAVSAGLIPFELPAGPNGRRRYRRSDLDAYSRSTITTAA